MATALLIVDIQNDFCEGGSLGVHEGNSVIPLINQIRENPKFQFIYRSRDWHPADHISFQVNNPGSTLFEPFLIQETGVYQMMWPVHCVQNTPGGEYHRDLVIKESDVQILKGTNQIWDSYSAFGVDADRSILLEDLKAKGVQTIYVCGLAFDYCVGSSAYDAVQYGFETYVVIDACRSVAEDSKNNMMTKLVNARVQFVNVEEINQNEVRFQYFVEEKKFI